MQPPPPDILARDAEDPLAHAAERFHLRDKIEIAIFCCFFIGNDFPIHHCAGVCAGIVTRVAQLHDHLQNTLAIRLKLQIASIRLTQRAALFIHVDRG